MVKASGWTTSIAACLTTETFSDTLTMMAYQDHGVPAVRLEDGLEQSETTLKQIADSGIDMEDIAQQLEDEGLDKFIKPFDVLLETLKSMVMMRNKKEGNA